MSYRKKNYRGKRGYSGRPHRRNADSYHQPLPPDQNRIPYTRHTLTKPDVESVVEALLSGTLTQGRELERFESLLAKLTHSEFAIAFSSGASAIHAALACLKLEPEDEVIIPTLAFSNVANMVALVGARTVLADCDPDTHTLSVESAAAAITEHTKAIFTNNFGGHPSDLQALRELCDEHNLILLEDASHGLGGKYRGHYVGNQADLTCFSFLPANAITTCEGGAVTTGNRQVAEWLRQFRQHGIQQDARFFSSEENLPGYYEELQFNGMNYCLSEVHAALGRSQLTRLDRHIERRRSIAQVYFQKLGSVEELTLPFTAEWADSAYHMFPIQFSDALMDHRDEIYEEMTKAGIEVKVHYVPMHRMPLHSRDWRSEDFPNAEAYFSRCLSLPLFCDLTYKDLERITDTLLKTIKRLLGNDGEVAGEPNAAAECSKSDPEKPTVEGENKEVPTEEALAPTEEITSAPDDEDASAEVEVHKDASPPEEPTADSQPGEPPLESGEPVTLDLFPETMEAPPEEIPEAPEQAEKDVPEAVKVEETPKPTRRRTTRRKAAPKTEKVATVTPDAAVDGEVPTAEEAPKKPTRRRTTRTKKTEDSGEETPRRRTTRRKTAPKDDAATGDAEAKPKRRTRRKKEDTEKSDKGEGSEG